MANLRFEPATLEFCRLSIHVNVSFFVQAFLATHPRCLIHLLREIWELFYHQIGISISENLQEYLTLKLKIFTLKNTRTQFLRKITSTLTCRYQFYLINCIRWNQIDKEDHFRHNYYYCLSVWENYTYLNGFWYFYFIIQKRSLLFLLNFSYSVIGLFLFPCTTVCWLDSPYR